MAFSGSGYSHIGGYYDYNQDHSYYDGAVGNFPPHPSGYNYDYDQGFPYGAQPDQNMQIPPIGKGDGNMNTAAGFYVRYIGSFFL